MLSKAVPSAVKLSFPPQNIYDVHNRLIPSVDSFSVVASHVAMEVPVAVAGWANHAGTFMSLIESYKTKELFCDCTLACDRKLFRAHKMILAMSSELFENIFLSTEDKNPVIILHEVEAWQVECLLNYMYKGETRVSDAHFIPLCRVAKSLQIKGFDKLELYREAVKQSGMKDSRLITKTEESRNENFFSLCPSETPFFKNTSQNAEKEESQRKASTCSIKCKGFSVLEGSSGSAFCDTFSSPQALISPSSISSPVKEKEFYESHDEHLPDKCQQHPTEQNKPDESLTASFSEKFNYHSSPTLHFKKNYLLSSSHCLPTSHKQTSITTTPSNEVVRLKTKISPQRLDANHNQADLPPPPHPPHPPTYANPQWDDIHKTTDGKNEKKLISSQKPLREPPPLLRITYGSVHEERPVKREDDNIIASNGCKANVSTHDCGHDSHQKDSTNSQQWLDNFLQMTLNSEPGSDPLLKKIPTNKRKRVRGPKSWEFLLRLLRSPESNPSLIKWENEEAGVFRLMRPEVIALRWGRRTGKHVHDILSYESFSRGLRYHYATGALCAVSEKSFVYQFGPKAQHALRASKDLSLLTK